ncbi:MAG: DMT family transporter [Balneolaceae bacterium]|nr:DMT family transporter [Balneolaceae bacterium]
MSLLFGLFTAIGFGAGDFFGGLASKKSPVMSVSLYSQCTAAILIGMIALFLGGSPDLHGLLWGAAAGIAVGLGIIKYYRALSGGSMGITATVMGVFSALVPFVAGFMIGERPSGVAITGVIIVIGALVLVTGGEEDQEEQPHPDKRSSAKRTGLYDGVIAGICFGFSFVFVGLATTVNPLWPVFATAAGSLAPLLIVQLFTSGAWPGIGSSWKTTALAGISQGLGFIAFGLAVLDGLISIVSVASALSPIPTALIALAVLGERLSQKQIAGVAVALVGVVFLVIG